MKAIITGILGQDGAYLAKQLTELGYEVVGICRSSSAYPLNTFRLIRCGIDHINLLYATLPDYGAMEEIIKHEKPDEIYNLAAQSHVGQSFYKVEETFNTNVITLLHIIDIIRKLDRPPKVYQASSSEMFGNSLVKGYLTKWSGFNPVSPYGVSKTAAHLACNMARQAYGLFIVGGIAFNHESALRGTNFVTQKVVRFLNSYKEALEKGKSHDALQLGNLTAVRDWGYAGDYVKAMHGLLQASKPEDHVIATGVGHTVEEMVFTMAKIVGFELVKKGDKFYFDGKVIIESNPMQKRPIDIEYMVGDPTLIKKAINWEPTVIFEELCEKMINGII